MKSIVSSYYCQVWKKWYLMKFSQINIVSSSLNLAMNLQWSLPSSFLQENKLGNQHAEKIGLRKYPCPNKNAILSYNNRRIIVNRRQNVYILLFRSFYNNVQRQNYLLHILEFYYPSIQFFFEEEIIKYSARLIKTIIVKNQIH